MKAPAAPVVAPVLASLATGPAPATADAGVADLDQALGELDSQLAQLDADLAAGAGQ